MDSESNPLAAMAPKDRLETLALPGPEWEVLDGLRRGLSHWELMRLYGDAFPYNLRKVYRDLVARFALANVVELIDLVQAHGMPGRLQ